MDNNHQFQKMQSYMEALEDEKRKIQVFQRELPLCLELVNQAIEACRQQLSGTTTEYMQGGQSQCSDQTSTDGPVLAEFIPIKRNCSASDDDEEEVDEQHSHEKPKSDSAADKKKSDWLRSAQLWNQTTSGPTLQQEATPRRVSVVEVTRNGGAFQPFLKENKSPVKTTSSHDNNHQNQKNQSLIELHSPVPVAATSSTADTTKGNGNSNGNGNGTRKEDKEGQTQRKQRRCWSPELHRRFLQALHQLGGSHTATPKQIRELMKVDGLTNDEVKSHLQKYRLHTRRPSPTIQHNGNSQAPQFVVVGGIWMPPAEYAAATSGEAAKPSPSPAGVYAPLAIPAAPQQQRNSPEDHSPSHSEGRGSHSAGDAHSKSPSTSSSTHTAASSPVD
ncbi:hypothetical protein BT93_D1878 [Corymbia citriodora subsp. variegata]|nr:hypothetical protein BT93_D1878 [Corymbia citriodora subsp. variegata]